MPKGSAIRLPPWKKAANVHPMSTAKTEARSSIERLSSSTIQTYHEKKKENKTSKKKRKVREKWAILEGHKYEPKRGAESGKIVRREHRRGKNLLHP